MYLLPGIQNSLDSLSESISIEKEIALPKKKFTFARRQPTAGQPSRSQVKEYQKEIQNIVSNDLSIKDIIGMEIRKTEQEYV